MIATCCWIITMLPVQSAGTSSSYPVIAADCWGFLTCSLAEHSKRPHNPGVYADRQPDGCSSASAEEMSASRS